MQIANVVGLGVLSSLPAAVAQWACLFLAPQPKMTRASSPNQRVIVARSILSKASQCALNVDQPVVRLRAGAGSMPFLLRMFATASNDISKSHHCTQAADGRTQQDRWSRLNRMVSWPFRIVRHRHDAGCNLHAEELPKVAGPLHRLPQDDVWEAVSVVTA